jgi:hypothetical protein
MNKGVSAGLICPTRLKKTVFVQEINAVQEFVNIPKNLNKTFLIAIVIVKLF